MSGAILPEAKAPWLANNTNERKAIDHFLATGFSVKWSKEKFSVEHNTKLRFCIVVPDQSLKAAYGFEYEILVVFHSYTTVESRTYKAIAQAMNEAPIKGRVEPQLYVLISMAPDVKRFTAHYLTENRDERITIPIYWDDLIRKVPDPWTIRNQFQEHYLSLDLFKNTLPLRSDTYFFGRTAELAKLLDSVRQVENIGLFGLRKTGKTSLLLKLKRTLEKDATHLTCFLDAQSTSIRKRPWHELLQYIVEEIYKTAGESSNLAFSEKDAADQFSDSLQRIVENKSLSRITILFDEIEWICPSTAQDQHWNSDFSAFWQSIRSLQTKCRWLSFVIAGVNPLMVESDLIEEYPNPLFGIVSPLFLKGMSKQESGDMIEGLGKLTGMRFMKDALSYLYIKYGGHPLLTRLACSYTFESLRAAQKPFPVQITEGLLKAKAIPRDRELRFYCRHIVSELEKFYPTEYQLLETLSCGDIPSYLNGARRNEGARHLYQYGVVGDETTPYVIYDVLQEYVAEENARKEGRLSTRPIVVKDQRIEYIKIRMRAIVGDMRTLESIIRANDQPLLFGANSFPLADQLFEIAAPDDQSSMSASLTSLQLSFVESIDNYGNSIGIKDYFWKVIKERYPSLHDALHRIRVYRHNAQHLVLKPGVDAALRAYLEKDLPGELLHHEERYWIIFQICLDELQRSLQREISLLRT